MKVMIAVLVALLLVAGACNFSEYAQSADVAENIDDYRTGCQVDGERLMAEYKRYDANEFHFDWGLGTPEPTPTPSPITDTEVSTAALLEHVWENGCQAGRRDAVGSAQASLMELRDLLDLLEDRLDAWDSEATP